MSQNRIVVVHELDIGNVQIFAVALLSFKARFGKHMLVWWPRSVIALGVGDRSRVSFSLATLFSSVGLSSFSEF